MDLNQSLDKAKVFIEQGYDDAFIASQLKQQGTDEAVISEVFKQVKTIRSAKRTQAGSRLILIGVILLGVGFISCVALHYSGSSINFSLYGLTMIGALILIAGLVMVFH